MPTHANTTRMVRLRAEMRRRKWPALLVSHLPSVRYLCGFTGSNGALLVTQRNAVLCTDGRYTVQARQDVHGASVEVPKEPLLAFLGAHAAKLAVGRMAVESDHLTVSQYGLLRRAAGRGVKLEPVTGAVEALRAVKDRSEISAIRAAAKLICGVFDAVVPSIRPGVRELEIAAEVDYQMRRRGAQGPSFETIVASGPRGALPHARPTGRKLRRGELVILDMGAILGGYCSDLTRTVFLGRAPARVRGWYGAVWEAHQAARGAARPGVACGDVDEAARSALKRHGLDQYFTHSTGHGIGLEIHEGPRLARGQKARLEAGNVVTIEPGVYIEGVGGIRIEDDVLITPKGPEVLTKMCGELLQL